MKLTVRKGLDINIKGKPEKVVADLPSPKEIALKPVDFPNLVPKLLVKEGDMVKCGSPVFCDKYNDKINFSSPVSGKINKIIRGEKRILLEDTITSDDKFTQLNKITKDYSTLNREELKNDLLKMGLWPYLRMRPIDIIALPSDNPKSIFISAFDSNPLSPDYDFIMNNKSAEFNAGIEILKLLTDGKVHLQTRVETDNVFINAKNVQRNIVKGPHPAGNVGTQIHEIDPINKGEVVWYVNPQDVLVLGIYSLTGDKVDKDGFLGFYHHQVTVLPEGNKHKFFLTDGWLSLGFNKFSASKSYPTWLMPKSKSYDFDTNLNGEERAFVVSGQYEKVFPFDIYPVQLIKSIVTNDIEKMENLGIYEVAPEDFALCEFVCTSKINVQNIVREGLDLVYKECM